MYLRHNVHRFELRLLLAIIGWTFIGFNPVVAQYLLAPGDVLEISVIGLPELRQKVAINSDGQISYPMIGTVDVVGHSSTEIQDKLRSELANKSVRTFGANNIESTIYIRPNEVTVSIAEYRPIYISGYVAKPGEIAYRSNLTVRQAVALAGGIDATRGRSGDPHLAAVDVQSESELLRIDYVRQCVIIARIKAELETISQLQLDEDFVAFPGASEFQRLQAEQLKLALEAHEKEVSSFLRALGQTTAQIETLERLKQELTESQRQQALDLARLKASYEKGLASVARISEEQRNLAYATERLLQTEAQLLMAKRGEEEQRRMLQKIEADRRLKLMQDLQEAERKLFEFRTRIRAAEEKLVYMGVVRSTFVKQPMRPHFQIVRKNRTRWDILNASEDLTLTPGDVVQVELTSDVNPDQP